MKKLPYKTIIFLIVAIFFIHSTLQSRRQEAVEAELSFKRNGDELLFEVKLVSPVSVHFEYLNDLERTISIFSEVENQKLSSVNVSDREGQFKAIIIDPEHPHIIHFTARIITVGNNTKITFGELGYIENLESNKSFDLTVSVFQKDFSYFSSRDGIWTNTIKVDLQSD